MNDGAHPPDGQGAAAFQRFLKAFGDLTNQIGKLVESQSDLNATIGDPKEGMIAAIDDLREDISSLVDELQLLRAAKGNPVDLDVGKILEDLVSRKRRR